VRTGRDLRVVSPVTWLQGEGPGALWDEFGLGWGYAGSGQGHVVCSQCALCCASKAILPEQRRARDAASPLLSAKAAGWRMTRTHTSAFLQLEATGVAS